jgi:hypothetical protein
VLIAVGSVTAVSVTRLPPVASSTTEAVAAPSWASGTNSPEASRTLRDGRAGADRFAELPASAGAAAGVRGSPVTTSSSTVRSVINGRPSSTPAASADAE